MGASALMSLGLRAMAASYVAMQATGHNISNANVAGYSRQEAELVTAKGQFTGAGFFGKGVDVKTVSRAHDEFLTRAAAVARSLSSMDAARQGRLEQLEQVFAPGEGGIGYATGQFLNAMVDLASRPGDNATRQVVLARAQDLASRFNSAQSQFDTIQSSVSEDLRTSVTAVNGIAKSLAAVNSQIAAVRGLGQPPNDLLDERDRLVSELSSYMQVTTLPADDGTMGVFIAGGQRLVLGGIASELQIGLDPEDASRSAVQLVEDGGGARTIDSATFGAGSLDGLLRFQNEDLVDARNLIGQIAAAVAGVVNAQQVLGVNLQEPAGSVPSQPLFAVGAPQAIAASTNAKSGGNYVAQVSLTVEDASALHAANYSLRPDPAGSGQYELTRLSKPPVTQMINSGDVVDGMRITVDVPLGATDRFTLKPVAAAAGGMKALLSDPRDLAAASPLIPSVNPANTGTAKVSSLTMYSQPPVPDATARITFTSDAGDYTWELFDAGGGLLSSGTATWSGGQTIPASGTDINGFTLALTGVPRTGDILEVQPIQPQYVAQNNGNAQALAALRDIAFVGRHMAADGSVSVGATATDAYATAMSDIGVRVQSAKSTATISASVAGAAEAARTSSSGVNLDEEAARLIQFQQAYQAAAKVLQIGQSVFQTLLDTAA